MLCRQENKNKEKGDLIVQVYGSHGPVQPAFVLIQVKTPFIASSNGHETDLARRRGQDLGSTLAFVIGREFKPWQAGA